MSSEHGKVIDVAAGAIVDSRNRVLITLRAAGSHQGGLWEFPGGKREAGESISAALHRELEEELGIRVMQHEHLITLTHAYADKTVRLCVFRVTQFDGEPHSREGQPLRWCALADLLPHDFPAADRGIIRALQLPRHCFITPALAQQSPEIYLQRIERALQNGIRLLILRDHQLTHTDFIALARRVQQLATSFGARCALNMPVEWLADIECDILHLTSKRLEQLPARPAGFAGWVTASCHDEQQLQHAVRLQADAALLSPVLPTASHPQTQTLGWQRFAELLRLAPMPVYALGGMRHQHLDQALDCGAQGIAGISAFL